MNIDVVDVRLDERKLPYLVSETVAEYRGGYVGEQRLKVNSPEKVVNVLNNVFHMKDFSEEKLAQAGITAEERYENQELSDCLKNISEKIEKTIGRYARG